MEFTKQKKASGTSEEKMSEFVFGFDEIRPPLFFQNRFFIFALNDVSLVFL